MASEDFRRASDSARLRRVEEQLAALMRGAGLRNAAIGAGGISVYGGTISVQDDGSVEFLAGDGELRLRLDADGIHAFDQNGFEASTVASANGFIQAAGPDGVVVFDNTQQPGMADANPKLLFRWRKAGGTQTQPARIASSNRNISMHSPRARESGESESQLSLDADGVQLYSGGVPFFYYMAGTKEAVLGVAGGRTFLPGNVLVNNGGLSVSGSLSVGGSKQFVMEHPSKSGHLLRHAATESPVSGVEYWGEAVTGADGAAVVELPAYFEDLVKPAGRAVLVTPQGAPATWSGIEAGAFTVTAEPGTRFSWLVKGERIGADFPAEEVGNLSDDMQPARPDSGGVPAPGFAPASSDTARK